jgi:hypothetical protein
VEEEAGMFWLLKFSIKWIIRIKVIALAVATGMAIAFGLQLRQDYGSWGLAADDAERGLSGDDLVEGPDLVETRRIDIDAPPSQVWPWLVQLGYGRGGWYGVGQLERPWSPGGGPVGSSSDVILEDYQDLAEGDVVPTHANGGFVARVVEPAAALVLYLDNILLREQVQDLVADRAEGDEAADEAAEALADMQMPPFAASWAFVLEDAPGGRTHLIERLRLRIEDISDAQRKGTPLLSTGLFVQMRSQMLGIKRRVEAVSEEAPSED